jgi:hypothetical protein
MKGMPPLTALRGSIQAKFEDVRQARFFRDRFSVTLLLAVLILNGLTLVSLAMRLRPVDGEVPIRFSSLTLFDALGPWYYPFVIAFMAFLVTLANGYFAYHSFPRSRLASFFLQVGSGVVAIFGFIIANAFGVVR